MSTKSEPKPKKESEPKTKKESEPKTKEPKKDPKKINVMLAHEYNPEKHNIIGWFMSEKLDGVRAIWDHANKKLMSRSLIEIHAPKWFTKDFPDMALDGELWIDRGLFNKVNGISRKHVPIDAEWSLVKYCVFDVMNESLDYETRMNQCILEIEKLHSEGLAKHLVVVQTRTLNTLNDLQEFKTEVLSQGAEGLMIRNPKSMYEKKRSKELLKYKEFKDAEAEVLRYEGGKNRNEGLVGALVVRDLLSNKVFEIGTGLTDHDRRNPPPVGSIIKYKYFEDTDVSRRFTSFIGLREC
jgi:DNA ligase-1